MIHNIAQLFEKVGNDEEVVKWIKHFDSCNGNFGVLKVGGDSLKDYTPAICEDLAILAKLDLCVPVVYGWGTALTDLLKKHNISSEKHTATNVRITKKEDLPYLDEIARRQGLMIVDGLESHGIHAEIVYGIFSAERKYLPDVEFEHFTGDLTSVDTQKIQDCISRHIIPLLPPLGYASDGQLMNINGDTAAKGVVLAYLPQKYIILNNHGGVKKDPEKEELISRISLSRDYDDLARQEIFNGGMKLKVDEAKAIFDSLPPEHALSVQIAHPENILIELFTDAGKGTYITR